MPPKPKRPIDVQASQLPSGGGLVRRFAELKPADQALVEFLMLDMHPIGCGLLSTALKLCAPEPEWAKAGVGEVAARMPRLREFLAPSRLNEIRPRQDVALGRAAMRSLIESGRARRYGEALVQHQAQVAKLESEYQYALRSRLRIAGMVGGAPPAQLGLDGADARYGSDYLEDATRTAIALLHDDDGRLSAELPPELAARSVSSLLWHLLVEPDARAPALFALGTQLVDAHPTLQSVLWLPLFDHALLRGEPEFAARVDPIYGAAREAALASAALFSGAEPGDALPRFDESLKQLRKARGPRTMPINLTGKLHLACLSVGDAPKLIQRRERLAAMREPVGLMTGGQGIVWWQAYAQAGTTGRKFAEPKLPEQARVDDWWWLGLLLRWSGKPMSAELRARLQATRAQASEAGWRWLHAQIGVLLDDATSVAQPALHDWFRPQPAWRTAIDALASALAVGSVGGKAGKSAGADRPSQLQIRLRLDEDNPRNALPIDVYEQRPRGDGWTAGRLLATPTGMRGALDRVAPGDDIDRQLLTAMVGGSHDSGYYGYPAGSRVVAALVGHPRVVDVDPPHAPLQVVDGDIALRATRLANRHIELRIDPPHAAAGDAFVLRRGQRVGVYKPDATISRIGEIVGTGLKLPEEAVGPLVQLLPELGRRLRLDADFAGLGIEEACADSGLVAQLETFRDGLALRIMVCPLGDGGPALPPGQGADVVIGTRDGRPCRAQRDLAAERRAFAELMAADVLPAELPAGERMEIDDPEAALDLLGRLQELPGLSLAWRAGKPLRVSRPRSEAALQVQVAAQRDWFSAKGGLSLDDGSVVALGEVLRALPSAQGRYLTLDGERVIKLDAELRRRLNVLRAFTDERGNVQVPKAAAFLLEAALDEASESDRAFRDQLQKMEQAQSLQPALPADFQAELRDYQIEGYRFLMRLAAWGGGACLADDMGLGKTVQALALLSARAADGPALVIAPTSVVANWRSEATRFAPNLVLRGYGDGNRAQALADLGPGDVVLVSYGMLASNIDAFAQIRFASLVLDEAQAIKNSATQRAQAVRQLQAEFRMAATGTPLENHLGELWSLFRVLNPGLLGSEEHFRRRFLLPLERDPRGPQRETLRRLIGPFLLRRTKAEVLSELPPRTEIVLSVEPSDGEARLLAALRRQALQSMQQTALPTEQRRFHILAELTRLRRAACHPMLVAPELGLPSSKLEQLVELVRELSDNHHRALVFSQFVDYLTLVRERFDAEGIAYRYLDGSTSPKAREAEVAAFQRGEGTVFLLSLKAGGVGLNLTAADYVIHLDPWWNPAVEQQASDRAHRIGQTRPVTVYKLVLAGSIEEQILALHGTKRELIDQVIGEQATAAAIGVDELLALLEE